MLTIGPGGGAIGVLDGWLTDPLLIVEGLFDALSLAVCGYACIATIGRCVPWLPEAASGRAVWLAFDAGRSGDAEGARLAAQLTHSTVHRLSPPGRSKDWNTALVKRGRAAVTGWLQHSLAR
jgi:DNA primase